MGDQHGQPARTPDARAPRRAVDARARQHRQARERARALQGDVDGEHRALREATEHDPLRPGGLELIEQRVDLRARRRQPDRDLIPAIARRVGIEVPPGALGPRAVERDRRRRQHEAHRRRHRQQTREVEQVVARGAVAVEQHHGRRRRLGRRAHGDERQRRRTGRVRTGGVCGRRRDRRRRDAIGGARRRLAATKRGDRAEDQRHAGSELHRRSVQRSRGRDHRRAARAHQGSASAGSVSRAASVSAPRNATRSARSSAVIAKPVMSSLLRGLLTPAPRPPAA